MAAVEALGLLVASTAVMISGLRVVFEYQDLPQHLVNLENLITLAAEKMKLLELELARVEGEIRDSGNSLLGAAEHNFPCTPHAENSSHVGEIGDRSYSHRDRVESLAEREIQYCHDFLKKFREFLQNFRKVIGSLEATGGISRVEEAAIRPQDEQTSSRLLTDHDPIRLQVSTNKQAGNGDHSTSNSFKRNKREMLRRFKRLKLVLMNSRDLQTKLQFQCQILQGFMAQADGLHRSLRQTRDPCCCCHRYDPYRLLFTPQRLPRDTSYDRHGRQPLPQSQNIDHVVFQSAIAAFVAFTSKTAGCVPLSYPKLVGKETPGVFTGSEAVHGQGQQTRTPERQQTIQGGSLVQKPQPLVYIINGKKCGVQPPNYKGQNLLSAS